MTQPLRYVQIAGSELSRIASLIVDAIETEESNHVIMACLAVALTAKASPNITPQQVIEGVQGASEWLATYLADLHAKELKQTVN